MKTRLRKNLSKKKLKSSAEEAIERLQAATDWRLGLCLISPIIPADGLLCQAGRRRALLWLPAPLSGAESSFPQNRAACAGLQRANTGRLAAGHLGEISHRPWVLCPAPCLVHIAACRCACPLPQGPPVLRALCRGWI